MSTSTPNMFLVESTINVDSGLVWETNLNSSLTIIDQHNHTPGSGVQIPPAGLNISSALTFQGNPATNLQATVYTPQTSLTTPDALYVKGIDLYFNDGASNVIQLTSGGAVNSTVSGISSGTATAAFSSGVLIVNAAANTPANIQGGSLLLGNNISGSNYLTLSPPNSMSSSYNLVLPQQPASTLFMTLDSSGNMGTAANIQPTQIAAGSIQGAQIVPGGITSTQIADLTITPAQLAVPTYTQDFLNINYSNSTTSYTNIVNSGAGITTVADRPVFIQFFGYPIVVANTSGSAVLAGIQIVNETTGDIIQSYIPVAASTTITTPVGAFSCTDVQATAATGVSYKLQAAMISGTATITTQHPVNMITFQV